MILRMDKSDAASLLEAVVGMLVAESNCETSTGDYRTARSIARWTLRAVAATRRSAVHNEEAKRRAISVSVQGRGALSPSEVGSIHTLANSLQRILDGTDTRDDMHMGDESSPRFGY